MSEQTLEQMLSNANARLIQSGKAAEILDKHVQEAFESTVKDITGWNSDFRKQLKEEAGKHLGFHIDPNEMVNLSRIISSAVAKPFSEKLRHFAEKTAEDIIEKEFKRSKPDKLQYRFDDFLEHICTIGDFDKDSLETEWDSGATKTAEMSIVVDDNNNGSFFYIGFDFESGISEKYKTKYRIGLHNGKIFSVNADVGGEKDEVTKFLLLCKYADVEIIDYKEIGSDEEYQVTFPVDED